VVKAAAIVLIAALLGLVGHARAQRAALERENAALEERVALERQVVAETAVVSSYLSILPGREVTLEETHAAVMTGPVQDAVEDSDFRIQWGCIGTITSSRQRAAERSR
jgi:hypothetical protein